MSAGTCWGQAQLNTAAQVCMLNCDYLSREPLSAYMRTGLTQPVAIWPHDFTLLQAIDIVVTIYTAGQEGENLLPWCTLRSSSHRHVLHFMMEAVNASSPKPHISSNQWHSMLSSGRCCRPTVCPIFVQPDMPLFTTNLCGAALGASLPEDPYIDMFGGCHEACAS